MKFDQNFGSKNLFEHISEKYLKYHTFERNLRSSFLQLEDFFNFLQVCTPPLTNH